MDGFNLEFEWDEKKDRTNFEKHGVSFTLAMNVLRDPLAVTTFDEAHSETEERWFTIGCTVAGSHPIRPKSNKCRTKVVRRRTMSDDPLDQEIDFSKGVRGKFYRAGADFHIPVYLEPSVLQTLAETANRKGVRLDDLVNDLLKKELAIVESLR